jgi:hypothetical protein
VTLRSYLPWVRTGAAAAVTADDGPAVALAARAILTVTATVTGSAGATRTATADLSLYGPGDVVALSPRQVIRSDPAPDSVDAEPAFFPLVEFDRPDLPWLFTPARAAGDRLRPWLCLVVVRREHGILQPAGTRPLPVLRVDDAAAELPDLAQSWAWAHAQDSADPALALSRLVCPRLLVPRQQYLAAVVPAFDAGRHAGLGEPVDEAAALGPAWRQTADPVELPVYHSWEFTTGDEGDFEALATRLTRHRAGQTVGSRPMVVADLPAGLPDLGTVGLPGALGAPAMAPLPAAFTGPLRALLDAPVPAPPGAAPPAGLPMAPPIYGRWHAGRPLTPAAGWLAELNLDPRYRAAAAAGTRIVQDQQEQLMAAAWQQAGQLDLVNRALRQAQLARAAARTVHSGLSGLEPAELLVLAGPALSRVLAGPGTTARAAVAASRVPVALVDGAARRLLRPRGPLARRSGVSGLATVLARVNAGDLVAVPPRRRPDGAVTLDEAAGAGRTRFCAITPAAIRAVQPPAGGAGQWKAMLGALAAHQAAMPGCEPPPPRVRPVLDVAGLRATVLAALDPEVAVPARVNARVRRPAGRPGADPIAPVMAAPEFPTPMWRALAALDQRLLLPGVGDLPPDSVTALPTNPAFVEAYLLGLNTELGRELLWRGYPTDQRGTYFARFWDRAAALSGAGPDVDPIAGWAAGSALGSHLRGGEQTVLLLRGALLRRYPNAVIYAAKAAWSVDAGGQSAAPRRPVQPAAGADPAGATYPERYPVFAGTLAPDAAFLGFDLDPVEAAGDPDPGAGEPGWFLVIQEQPTEARFGLDADAASVPTGTWRDLGRPNVGATASGHVDLSIPLVAFPTPADPRGLAWGLGSTSAALAAIVEQPAFRAAIHASDLLPETP